MRKPYRLGLDIGTNSIGWWILFLNGRGEPCETGLGGVRLFTDGRDPKSKATLASDRRLARSMRRRRDRYLRRKQALLEALKAAGLIPADPGEAKALEGLDPFALRAAALDQRLSLYEFGRALFHLNQRRGFKSNRKADDDDDGVVRQGIAALESEMQNAGARTVGEYLQKRIESGRSARARPNASSDGKGYVFYPSRALIEAEFDALWIAQAQYYPDVLTDQLRQKLHRIIFYQRPLKPVDPGKCTFIDGEPRAPQAHPLFQRFRILTELANLRIVEPDQSQRPLSMRERNILLADMAGEAKDMKPKKAVSFDRMRRLLKLEGDTRFSLEDSGRKDLQGDLTGAAMIRKGYLDPQTWGRLALKDREKLVDRLLHVEQEEDLIEWLIGEFGLEQSVAEKLSSKPGLPAAYGRLSVAALRLLVPILEKETRTDKATGQERPIGYSEACEMAGWHHSDLRTGEIFDRLPYYGQVLPRETVDAPATVEAEAVKYGWVANPTVHIGLNQLRQLVNRIIARYGHPQEIVIELMRELKLNSEQKKKIQADNREREERRRKWKDQLENDLKIESPSPADMIKMRLFEEMPAGRRQCVFSGEQISLRRLFSDEIEVEHIIPFSRCLDDGFMNKVLATRAANRRKGNRTPFEAFGNTPEWDEIVARTRDLSPAKRKRFSPDFAVETDEFLARHLNDGRYLARLAKGYLSAVCHPDRVWVVPGRLTALLRGKWGLNDPLGGGNVKTRMDHRHHANDAFVVACTDRATLNRLSRAAGRAEESELAALVDEMPPPFEGFDREGYIRQLRKIIVSYRPNHSHLGQLHNDTAYGLTGSFNESGTSEVVHRKPLDAFAKSSDLNAVRDTHMRDYLRSLAGDATGKELQQRLGQARDAQGNRIRSVRVLERLNVIPINDDNGKRYKAYKGDNNWCFEITEDDKGKWHGSVISTFDAHQRARNGSLLDSKAVLRLFKDDVISIRDPDDSDRRRYVRVVKFSGNSLVTADHFEGGNLKARDADKGDPFNYLTKSADWYRQHDMRPAALDTLGRPSRRSASRQKARVRA